MCGNIENVEVSFIESPDEEWLGAMTEILVEGVYAYLKKSGCLRQQMQQMKKVQCVLQNTQELEKEREILDCCGEEACLEFENVSREENEK